MSVSVMVSHFVCAEFCSSVQVVDWPLSFFFVGRGARGGGLLIRLVSCLSF